MPENCPVCHHEMYVRKFSDPTTDYICEGNNDHWFGIREEYNKTIYLKVRFTQSHNKYYLMINYPKNLTQVWTAKNKTRIRIHSVFTPDFSDINKLMNKIKTYLVLS